MRTKEQHIMSGVILEEYDRKPPIWGNDIDEVDQAADYRGRG